MELKLPMRNWITWRHMLLIVPYGIETWKKLCIKLGGWLLIVPYGIETDFAKKIMECKGIF